VRDANAGLLAAELLELNRDLQGSRAIRLLAATNISLYATLMERHLGDGAVAETELVVRLERDLEDLDDAQSGLALIKSWASQGWLHRVADQRAGIERNLCYLTQDARRALDFLRGMRRQDTIATGGSINGIASRLKQVAIRVGNDPDRIRAGIEAVPRETMEAAESLGYSRLKAYAYVILPLAFRISLPALNNNLVNLVKTTTIAYAIAVPEMLYVANQIWSDESNVPEMMNVLMLVYVGLVGLLVWVMGRWERALRIPGYTPA